MLSEHSQRMESLSLEVQYPAQRSCRVLPELDQVHVSVVQITLKNFVVTITETF